MRKSESFIAGAIVLGVQILFSVPSADAFPASEWHSEFDNGWADWHSSPASTDVTAQLSYTPTCSGGPDGLAVSGPDEFHFSFRIGASCYVPGAIDDGIIAATFTWVFLDANGQPVEFPCLNVRGVASTSDGLEGEIAFGIMSYGAASTTHHTSDQLTNVDQVDFALVLPSFILTGGFEPQADELGSQNGYASHYDIDISIRRCSSGWDGPDIEHYRRMAEQTEALPNTR